MFLTHTKAQTVNALRLAFEGLDEPDFVAAPVSLDYPVKQIEYPSIWVDFEPQGTLSTVGVGHDEYIEVEGAEVPGSVGTMYRWKFSGYISFTALALTNFERDRLIDLLIRIMAFSRADITSIFRTEIEKGTLIGMAVDWDQIEMRGFSTSPGTPWGGDEMVYEGTISMEVAGEFVNSPTGLLLPLSAIEEFSWIIDTEEDPTTGSWPL